MKIIRCDRCGAPILGDPTVKERNGVFKLILQFDIEEQYNIIELCENCFKIFLAPNGHLKQYMEEGDMALIRKANFARAMGPTLTPDEEELLKKKRADALAKKQQWEKQQMEQELNRNDAKIIKQPPPHANKLNKFVCPACGNHDNTKIKINKFSNEDPNMSEITSTCLSCGHMWSIQENVQKQSESQSDNPGI